jgi:hypothetical protein
MKFAALAALVIICVAFVVALVWSATGTVLYRARLVPVLKERQPGIWHEIDASPDHVNMLGRRSVTASRILKGLQGSSALSGASGSSSGSASQRRVSGGDPLWSISEAYPVTWVACRGLRMDGADSDVSLIQASDDKFYE